MPDEQANWKKQYGPLILRIVTYLVTLAMGALAGYLGIPAPPPLIVEVEKPDPAIVAGGNGNAPAFPDSHFAMGWVKDDDAVKAVTETLPFPVFSATPAGLVEEVPASVYLWDVAIAATGAHIPARDQGGVGSCVAFGSACAVEYSQCVAIVAAKKSGRPPPEFKAVSQEVIYGGSRVEIGGGRIRGDGSVGGWGAQWCQKWGSIARGVYGKHDLSAYSESRCRQYGNSGCPDDLEPEAKLYPTKSISQVRTVDEAKKSLSSGYPVTVASDVGFGNRGPYTRNSKGQLKASGTWMHQMCLIGYDKDSGFYCMNSWGRDWVGGPTGPGNPPPGGFYIEEATVARMLAQNDSWAYGDQVGFPARRPDWFIIANRKDSFASGEVLPRSPLNDKRDCGTRGVVLSSELVLADSAGSVLVANCSNYIVGENGQSAPLAVAGGVVLDPIRLIGFGCVPSQVTQSVVEPVPVVVASLHSSRRLANEHQQNQSVDGMVLAANVNLEISVLSRLEWTQPSPFTARSAPNAPVVPGAVAGESWNVLVRDRRLSFRHDRSVNWGGCV